VGIDIRKGLQYECIGCGLCIDACNSVMDKMEYPRGLIRLTTQNAVAKAWKQVQVIRRIFRPRVLIYSAVLVALSAAMIASLVLREPLKVDVIRDRAALSRIVAGGKLENVYRLQIMNATESEQRYRISAVGLENLEVASEQEVTVGPAETRGIAVRLQIPYGSAAPGSHPVHFNVDAVTAGAGRISEKTVFLVPR
jgi:polyferredoxin